MSSMPVNQSVPVEALHQPEQQAQVLEPQLAEPQPPTGQLTGASALLAKKVAQGQNYYSPTDNMLSPCTSRLFDAKKRHHTKGKPLSLHNSFAAAQLETKKMTQQKQQQTSSLASRVDTTAQENQNPAIF